MKPTISLKKKLGGLPTRRMTRSQKVQQAPFRRAWPKILPAYLRGSPAVIPRRRGEDSERLPRGAPHSSPENTHALIRETHPTVGVALFRPKSLGRLSSSREELPISEAISRAHTVLELRHRSLVGLCERTPSISSFGREMLGFSCEDLRDLPCTSTDRRGVHHFFFSPEVSL